MPGSSTKEVIHQLFAGCWAHAQEATFVVDPAASLVIEANPAAERLTGYSRQELAGMSLTDLHPQREIVEDPRHAYEGASHLVRCYLSTLGQKGGDKVPIVFSSSDPFTVDGRELELWVLREMSDLEMQRHRLATLQWALSAYGGVALALVQADSSQGLLQAICEAITRESAYALAWVGTAEDSPGKPVQVIASAGRGKKSLDGLRISWDENQETGNGVAGMAIRTGTMHIIEDVETSAHFRPWREWARRAGVQSLLGIPLLGQEDWRGVLVVYAGRVNAFEKGAVDVFQHLATEISHGLNALHQKELLQAEYQQRTRAQQQLAEALTAMVSAMVTAVETRDPYTAGHENRSAEIACAIGRELGWDADRLVGLRMAAMVHDFGKISVPTRILTKPGRLTPEEWELMVKHPETGYEILKDIPFTWPVADIMRQHHEKLDGSGYPLGLMGDDILPEAKVLAVADILEAMTSDRPYRKGMDLHLALEELERQAGVLIDAEAVRACVRLFREKAYKLPE
jgi:PAS domain S-box-containing protein